MNIGLYFSPSFAKISLIRGVSGISAWQEIRNGFDFSYLLSLLLGVIPSLLCITLHELSHGLVAYRLGDPTAKLAGRLTLNPFRHLDPMGMLMMLVFHVGWAKPVPVNMRRFKDPKRGMAITALAGPASNLILAAVFLFLYGLLYRPLSGSAAGDYLLQMLDLTAVISLGLCVFNLLPFPPLDGSKVLFSLLSDEGYLRLMRYERYGSLVLFALVWAGVLGRPIHTAINWVYTALFPLAEGGFSLANLLFYR